MTSYDVIMVEGLSQAGTIALKYLGQHRKCGVMYNEQMLSLLVNIPGDHQLHQNFTLPLTGRLITFVHEIKTTLGHYFMT